MVNAADGVDSGENLVVLIAGKEDGGGREILERSRMINGCRMSVRYPCSLHSVRQDVRHVDSQECRNRQFDQPPCLSEKCAQALCMP